MTIDKQSFYSESELNDHIEEKFDFRLDLDTNGSDQDFELIETPDSLIVGYLSQDSDVEDFWTSSDGLGTFTEFRSQDQVDETMKKLNKTSKLFYMVDKYDHSSVHYSVSQSGSYPDERWDVSRGVAVIVPCDDVQSQYKKYKKEHGEVEAFKQFIKDTNGVLDEYSKWCNGDTYGYQVKTFDKTGAEKSDDACWGFIGSEYANQEKLSVMMADVRHEQVVKLVENVTIDAFTKDDIKNLPFKIMKKGFEEGKIAKVYDDIIIAAKYEGEDKSVVYQWNPELVKPNVDKFEKWQKEQGVTPEQFLERTMQNNIKDVIREKLTAEEKAAKTAKVTI
jgi:hypothetical protein